MRRALEFAKSESLLVITAALFVLAFAMAPARALEALRVGGEVLLGVLPIIVAVFAAIGLFNVWVDKKAVARRLGEGSGLGTIVLASLFGTVLIGPVYVIFPLLKAVREHGARWAIVGSVLTAWAVKIPMIPLEIGFLGIRFSLARTILVAISAIPLGLLLEYVMRLGAGEVE
jgi:uncharacterized membrane protein YraQ (UPF0718 family)